MKNCKLALFLTLLNLVLALSACGQGGAAETPPAASETPMLTIATPTPPVDGLTTPVPVPTASYALGETWTRPADEMVMVFVPPGRFETSVQPIAVVTLDGFWIDRTEVTVAQYQRCVLAGTCAAPTVCDSGGPNYGDEAKADHPVVCVNWYQARTYCQWVGGRLPTEAEWEYAARGEGGSAFPWGETFDGTRLNFCDTNCPFDWKSTDYDDGYAATAPVASFPNGASWCGVLDMAGNVWEWVGDWSLNEDGRIVPTDNATDPGRSERKVLRGGSWVDVPDYVRSTHQIEDYVGDRDFYNGFRCSVPLTPSP